MSIETILTKLLKSVCTDLGVTPENVKKKCRNPELVLARQIYCYWACDSELFRFKTIGDEIFKDHSTVIAAQKNVVKKYKANNKRMQDAISKTAENAEKILELYSRPSTNIRVLRLLGLLEMADYTQCDQTTRARAKKILAKILSIEKELDLLLKTA